MVCTQTALPLPYDTITDIGIWPQDGPLGLYANVNSKTVQQVAFYNILKVPQPPSVTHSFILTRSSSPGWNFQWVPWIPSSGSYQVYPYCIHCMGCKTTEGSWSLMCNALPERRWTVVTYELVPVLVQVSVKKCAVVRWLPVYCKAWVGAVTHWHCGIKLRSHTRF